ncbi:MAG: PBP1A family penicillin-binding protein [Acidobacteriaceae bacterium]
MPVKVRIKPASAPKSKRAKTLRGRLGSPMARGIVAGFIILCLIGFALFAYQYVKYQKIVDERIRKPIFNNAAKIYAAPQVVRVGDKWSAREIANDLRHAGYTEGGEQGASKIGIYGLHGSSVEVKPGPESYHAPDSATIDVESGKVAGITGGNGDHLTSYELEPQLVTGLFDSKERSKRRLITYDEMPRQLVDAIVSVEDRRFFEHSGINYFRLVEGILAPVLSGHRMQGGSTLTMQMARGFFLSNKRDIRRKMKEMLIAIELEQRFSKKQILELYVNQVDMGQRGSFNIRGFGEAAQAYFGKDIQSVNLPESALLAGIVNGPTYFSPYRHPEHALERRNLVLQAMFENNAITKEQMEQAKATPLKLAPPNVDSSEAPHYIDLVRDTLLARYKDSELNDSGMRIYTGLDPDLQAAAAEAVDAGMKQVDNLIRKQRTHKIKIGKGKSAKTEIRTTTGPMPQVALVVLDPHTGNVLALLGGRNYGVSQLNHATSKRPTGSIFKPFVYAAAINTALSGDPSQAYSQASLVDGSLGCFDSDQDLEPDKGPYCPRNFDPKYSVPDLSFRTALAHSVNTAAIRVAQMVGYDKVANLARAAGIPSVRATPAMAIGAYDATPLDMAGAYTVFANGGTLIEPQFITSVRAANGEVIQDFTPQKTSLLDPRVAYVMTDMMEAVINNGTAAAVRASFAAPAAGKTGTSHDAWFAGYTSNLLCIVWVGNDDYSDIKIEGSKAAAPIWTEFMKRASVLQQYKDMKSFTPPAGVNQLRLDKVTNLLAAPSCPEDYSAYFIDGTGPTTTCEHPAGDNRNIFQKIFGLGDNQKPPAPPPVSNTPGTKAPGQTGPAPPPSVPGSAPGQTSAQPAQIQNPATQPKKRGFWGKVFGAGDKSKDKKASPADNSSQPKEP